MKQRCNKIRYLKVIYIKMNYIVSYFNCKIKWYIRVLFLYFSICLSFLLKLLLHQKKSIFHCIFLVARLLYNLLCLAYFPSVILTDSLSAMLWGTCYAINDRLQIFFDEDIPFKRASNIQLTWSFYLSVMYVCM